MKRLVRLLLVSLILSLGFGKLPAQAQISKAQVEAMVEALRQAAPQTGSSNDGLYSDWQVKPDNIPRWSKSCIGRELSPAQFEASAATARSILVCVVQDVMRDEYRVSGNNEALAVRRTAAWWMTGDPQKYNSEPTVTYTQKVFSLYQKLAAKAGSTPQTNATTPEKQSSEYDRYMQAGYAASKRKDYPTALLYFGRALDERPQDVYAQQAIRNVERFSKGNSTVVPATVVPTTAPTTAPATASAAALTQQQALNLVSQWLQAKQRIFAPPFEQQLMTDFTTGELYTGLTKSDGVISWLKNNEAYYRFGVQKLEGVERFVTAGPKATIEIKVTEDRTLYRNGKVEPKQTDFSTQLIRYSLELVNGKWKIADYKTVNGSTLERAVIDTANNR